MAHADRLVERDRSRVLRADEQADRRHLSHADELRRFDAAVPGDDEATLVDEDEPAAGRQELGLSVEKALWIRTVGEGFNGKGKIGLKPLDRQPQKTAFCKKKTPALVFGNRLLNAC